METDPLLRLLLLEIDFLLELGILDDLVQSRGNLRVQHLRSSENIVCKLREDFNSCKESTVSTSLSQGRTKMLVERGSNPTLEPKWRDRQNQSTIPMPTFATRPLTTSSTMLVELPQNYMVGQQRQQTSELQYDKIPNPQPFLVWKLRGPGGWCPQTPVAGEDTVTTQPAKVPLPTWVDEVEQPFRGRRRRRRFVQRNTHPDWRRKWTATLMKTGPRFDM